MVRSIAVIICIALSAISNAQSMAKPNIVLIVADDLGFADVQFNNGWIETPNLNRLAADGMCFSDFHTSGSVCSPTRAGLMTGLYQYRVGVPGVIVAMENNPEHKRGLDPAAVTFPEVLRKNGYTTGLFGKWHLGYDQKFNPLHYGFDNFKGFLSGQIDYRSHVDLAGNYDWWNGTKANRDTGYTTRVITKYSVDFIKQNKQRPFCLVVAHAAVHSPYQGSEDPTIRAVGNTVESAASPVRDKKETFKLMMQEMDKGIGEIRQALKEEGLENNTIVIFISDNGGVPSVSSNAPFRGGKGMVWEGGHRVPAVVCWLGKIKGGVVSDMPCISLDIMPTLLELTGSGAPAGYKSDGMSLSGLMLKNKPQVQDRNFFWNSENLEYQYGVRNKDWKLVVSKTGTALLFDIVKDKGEKNNIAAQHPEVVKKMHASYMIWKKDVGLDKYFTN